LTVSTLEVGILMVSTLEVGILTVSTLEVYFVESGEAFFFVVVDVAGGGVAD
jgi:hypothetical protein